MSPSMLGDRVLVVGDVMLDVFEEGNVERISPEAPVPVVQITRTRHVLGGAANAAASIAALGRPTALVGLVGTDTEADTCRRLLAGAEIADGLLSVEQWQTIVKRRFIAAGQQMLRVDRESRPPAGASEGLAETLRDALNRASVVVISDYDKGSLSDRIARESVAQAQRLGIPCIVDTKRVDVSVFAGCSIIAPNHMEATRMTGASDPAEAAARIADVTGSAVLVTLGAEGMLLYRDGAVDRITSEAREVADVTGAGDSVTAGLADALGRGLDALKAARFATKVAAVAVGRHGTYAVTQDDLSLRESL